MICFLKPQSVKYLGHVVLSDGLSPITSRPSNISFSFPISIVVSLNIYPKSHFCHFPSQKRFPFSPSLFNEDSLSQFQRLQESFTTSPILNHFNPSLAALVETNASDYDLGSVLSQVNDSGKHCIAFDSFKLLPADLNYFIHDKELLGIVWALKH
ncbi:hypothetical protein O181_013431 [Austropuccinia psidii MF-1]|uniref:Reverse transcriptase/retrotransposon-derived protein RNase H-like domain-containing protein n=1 Tax=Austropuccinia psidii MF-1 TaxID=1389203 RepID=A0A9Q3BWE1_9BASI|nr:hypothetical protein [Austropuccinia psidii MF-1]